MPIFGINQIYFNDHWGDNYNIDESEIEYTFGPYEISDKEYFALDEI